MCASCLLTLTTTSKVSPLNTEGVLLEILFYPLAITARTPFGEFQSTIEGETGPRPRSLWKPKRCSTALRSARVEAVDAVPEATGAPPAGDGALIDPETVRRQGLVDRCCPRARLPRPGTGDHSRRRDPGDGRAASGGARPAEREVHRGQAEAVDQGMLERGLLSNSASRAT